MPLDDEPIICRCPQCHPDPLYTFSDEYRHLCEVRAVTKMESVARIKYLTDVKTKRGEPALDRIVKSLDPSTLKDIEQTAREYRAWKANF